MIILCGKQNLPLRGHEEKESNVIAILHHRAKYSSFVAHHLQPSHQRMKYTSPNIQNELTRLCGLAVGHPNNNPFYGVIVNEATEAIYTHYTGNDVTIVHARKELLLRKIIETVQQIVFCINYSAKKLRASLAELELDGEGCTSWHE